MKLMLCLICTDLVPLQPDVRYCKCGKNWGRYLEDNATTVQTSASISLGLASPDISRAVRHHLKNPDGFSPHTFIRAWINPDSEPDVKYVSTDVKPDQIRYDVLTLPFAGAPPITDKSQEEVKQDDSGQTIGEEAVELREEITEKPEEQVTAAP